MILKIGLFVIIAFLALGLYCLCAIARRADDQIDRFLDEKKWEEK